MNYIPAESCLRMADQCGLKTQRIEEALAVLQFTTELCTHAQDAAVSDISLEWLVELGKKHGLQLTDSAKAPYANVAQLFVDNHLEYSCCRFAHLIGERLHSLTIA